jgi:hypothetical protein
LPASDPHLVKLHAELANFRSGISSSPIRL